MVRIFEIQKPLYDYTRFKSNLLNSNICTVNSDCALALLQKVWQLNKEKKNESPVEG